MIRRLLVLLIIAALLAGVGYLMSLNNGYVLISYQSLRYESSLWVFLGVLVVILLLLMVLRGLWAFLRLSGRTLNPWSRHHRRRRRHRAAERGMLELSEARWAKALDHLKLAAESEPHPLPLYFGAARAANELGRADERDALLNRALERQPKAELAIGLTHAELQQNAGEYHGAQQTLQAMGERHPRHPQVLRQLAGLYPLLGNWAALLASLPELRKQKVMAEDDLLRLERSAWLNRLRDIDSSPADTKSLAQEWQQLSAKSQEDAELVAAYAIHLQRLGGESEAESVLRQALQRSYDARLLELYGRLRSPDPAGQLRTAERWLDAHREDAVLLRCLGRLSLQNGLWGKARDYLESSLAFSRDPETCAELSRLLAQLGDESRSRAYFIEGMAALDSRLPVLPQPGTAVR